METAARFGAGGVDAVVPCARARPGPETSLTDCSYAAFDDTLRTNARGVFATIREALPHTPPDGRVVVPAEGVAPVDGDGTASEGGDTGGAYAVSVAAAAAVARGFAAGCEQAVGCIDPGLRQSDGHGEGSRDLAAAGEQVLWALTGAPAGPLDCGVLTREDWRAATG